MQALVIDSNLADHAALVQQLQQCGYSTISVTSIADARQALVHYPFDLLLLESRLPDGNGSRLCYEIREKLGYQLVIIVVTEHDTPLNRAATLELGADDFVAKPYDQEELLTRIQTLQRRQQMTLSRCAIFREPVALNVPVPHE